MNKKTSKLLFELTRNSRITTKELSKSLRVSQQAASYLVNRFKRKNFIKKCTAIVDAVKLGYTKVIVGFEFIQFEKDSKKEIIDYFKSASSVTSIEESKQVVDLIVEYSSANLSAFNKIYSETAEKFRKSLKTKFIFPMIVKHKLRKNYLSLGKDRKDIILSGDRNLKSLNEKEIAVLNEIARTPDATLVSIAKKTKIPIKTTTMLKKKLEKMMIIKGYSCILDNDYFGIRRRLFFVKLANHSAKEMSRLVEYSRQHKNIVDMTKIIGNYHAIIGIEDKGKKEVIREIRELFQVEDYFIAESTGIHKKTYLPLE